MSTSSDPPLLDTALLDRYADLLRAQSLPFDDWTNPGLSEAEIAELAAPLPFALPVEARVWWGWRDGTNPAGRAWSFGPGRYCLSPSSAVQEYQRDREGAERSAADPGISGPRSDPDFMWHPGWLSIFPGGQVNGNRLRRPRRRAQPGHLHRRGRPARGIRTRENPLLR